MKRLRIKISGIVQGVGFRPFLYKLAQSFDLAGYVLNNAAGVEIEIEGTQERVASFMTALRQEAPPLAVLVDVQAEEVALAGEQVFTVKQSVGASVRTALVSPDVAICADCLRELTDPDDRRYRYPFINCTNCGPRYSIIKDVPYDRAATTMAKFIMCPSCQKEYADAADRRFHAQPNACEQCGPAYTLIDGTGRKLKPRKDVFTAVRRLVKGGAIVAIKGIGGYHLACDARNSQAVGRLRSRKIREDKPFAVMCTNIATVRTLCRVSPEEERLLAGIARPIVLLAKGESYDLAAEVAPENPNLGVMLPYAPVHFLLLADEDVWVMTSGNTSDEPIAYEDEDALTRLAPIADYFLVHNRSIYRRADDSVARVVFGTPYMLRRSRGFVPSPVGIGRDMPPVLAAGGELKNTFCLTRGNMAFMSAHIGDLENLATYQSYVDCIEHFKKLLDVRPEVVAYDLHPEYLATKYALAQHVPAIGVQHHHAHIAAVLAEHHIDDTVIGVAFDGTGYGTDGHLWGGEFLLANCRDFVRAAHFRYMPLPGGAKAIREPWRQAAWMLYELYGNALVSMDIPFVRSLPNGWQLAVTAARKGINAPLASGVGRLFDTVAALLGVRQSIHYEGQAAVELELAAAGMSGEVFPYHITPGEPCTIDFRPFFLTLLEKLQAGEHPGYLAACFHATLATATVDMIKRIHDKTGISQVALSGGVWQNVTLLYQVVGMLRQKHFSVYLHRQVPANDGGLALGQAIVAGCHVRN